jgi:hypothetical protein
MSSSTMGGPPPTSEFGSVGMATEQATRMLRTYRRKLTGTKEEINLGELEGELELVLRLIREKREQDRRDNDLASGSAKTPRGTLRRMKSKPLVASGGGGNAADDVDDLAALMDRTNLAERSPKGVKV